MIMILLALLADSNDLREQYTNINNPRNTISVLYPSLRYREVSRIFVSEIFLLHLSEMNLEYKRSYHLGILMFLT